MYIPMQGNISVQAVEKSLRKSMKTIIQLLSNKKPTANNNNAESSLNDLLL
jgi:hypothetical protein